MKHCDVIWMKLVKFTALFQHSDTCSEYLISNLISSEISSTLLSNEAAATKLALARGIFLENKVQFERARRASEGYFRWIREKPDLVIQLQSHYLQIYINLHGFTQIIEQNNAIFCRYSILSLHELQQVYLCLRMCCSLTTAGYPIKYNALYSQFT